MAPIDPIKVYGLDQFGVVVDTDPLNNTPGLLTKAQNAIADPLGEMGVIRKRPGLKKFNGTAGSGYVKGGIAVPLLLGSAGPDFANPFQDAAVTATALFTPVFTVEPFPRKIFDDTSFALNVPLFPPDVNTLDSGVSAASSTANSVVPLIYLGYGINPSTSTWALSTVNDLGSFLLSSTSYPNTKLKLFPSGIMRDTTVANATHPMYALYHLGFANTASFGRSAVVLNNKIYYASSDYTVGTGHPPIRVFDAASDEVIARVPFNFDVSSTTPPTAIVTMLAANGQIYFSTIDGGTNSGTSGGTLQCSVYSLDPSTGAIKKLGATFATGTVPTALCFAYGKLWAGVSINSTAGTTTGFVYWIRPDIGTAWTLDNTFGSTESFIADLAVFQGQIYAAIEKNTSGGIIYVRSSLGVWSSSDTTGRPFGLLVWPDENSPVNTPAPALFANAANGADNTTIRKLSGGSWSSVFTNSNQSMGLWSANAYVSGALAPVLWAGGGGNEFVHTSPDGSTWTTIDLSGNSILTGTGAILGLLVETS